MTQQRSGTPCDPRKKLHSNASNGRALFAAVAPAAPSSASSASVRPRSDAACRVVTSIVALARSAADADGSCLAVAVAESESEAEAGAGAEGAAAAPPFSTPSTPLSTPGRQPLAPAPPPPWRYNSRHAMHQCRWRRLVRCLRLVQCQQRRADHSRRCRRGRPRPISRRRRPHLRPPPPRRPDHRHITVIPCIGVGG